MNIFDIRLGTNSKAHIKTYIREQVNLEQEALPAVIICPGGGYEFLSNRESEPIALAFLAQGYQAIVLNYTTMADEPKENFLSTCVDEVAKTFEIINQHSTDWNIDVHKIFILGCSAGGHLAASYSNSWQKFSSNKETHYQPLGTILCYPVISFEYGWPEKINHFPFTIEDIKQYDTCTMINDKTPPTFIWHTANDATVPVINAIKYCEKLSQYKIPFAFRVYENGRHGLSLATKSTAKYVTSEYIDTTIAHWFIECIDWMNTKL